MENSQVKRAAVAAAQPLTVPLDVLVECLAALRAIKDLGASDVVPIPTLVDARVAQIRLGFYLDEMLAAQQVGVTA